MGKKLNSGIDFYQRNTGFKWVVLSISILISIGSIYYTDILVEQLKGREREQVELFAKALEYTLKDESTNPIPFVTDEIIFKNNSIPTILVDEFNEIVNYRNVQIDSSKSKEVIHEQLLREIEIMKQTYDPILINLNDPSRNFESFGTQKLYYKNSALLSRLTAFPYVQLSVIAIFGFIAFLAFNYSKAAEQNRVWVGLAKETAHQLGTPLSSLMAWVEVLRDEPSLNDKTVVQELEKDIAKLKTVTERFSSIGSSPVLKEENVVALVQNAVIYLRPRISSKIQMEVYSLSDRIMSMVHAPLFEWVVENLCKNAVDAIGSSGSIAIKILRGVDGKVFIDISDTGKGVPRSEISHIFKAGFTTKKRGWGLGLTLAKRIIETYHKGKIFVKSSDENMGTTFRIVLNAA